MDLRLVVRAGVGTLAWGMLLCLAGCTPSSSISFETGELPFTFSGSSLQLPAELREETPDGARVASLACGGDVGSCPAIGAAVVCSAGFCDPQPTFVEVPVGDVLDIEAARPDLDTLFAEVDAIELTRVDVMVSANTLTLTVPEVELYWAPESEVALDLDPSRLVGKLGALAAGTVMDVPFEMNDDGRDALSDYLVSTAHRVRFIARAPLDVDPLQPFPEGELTYAFRMAIRISGKLL